MLAGLFQLPYDAWRLSICYSESLAHFSSQHYLVDICDWGETEGRSPRLVAVCVHRW
jgi:hypothetical protein